jgi:hypothetical protein
MTTACLTPSHISDGAGVAAGDFLNVINDCNNAAANEEDVDEDEDTMQDLVLMM